MMTVAGLKRILQGFDDDTEVRAALEQDWAIEDDGDHVDSRALESVTIGEDFDEDGEPYDQVVLLLGDVE